jgi:hypothetical protein
MPLDPHQRPRERNEWKFFAVLPRASRGLAAGWWTVLLLRGLLPAMFALASGGLIAALQAHRDLTTPLALVGTAFVLLQVLGPLHQVLSANLGSSVAAWLYDRLTAACVAPPGIGHLEDPALAGDLIAARDFDLGMTGPPMHINVDFIAGSLVEMVGGMIAALALFTYAWWAPPVLAGAWLATHWLLRESAVWQERNTEPVRAAQRHADYAYRLAVDPPAAKELRLFGLVDWTLERFLSRRKLLYDLQYKATRLRERPLALSLVLVTGANLVVIGSIAAGAASGRLDLGHAIAYAQLALATGMIAFGGLNWALDGASAPVGAVLRLEPAMAVAGVLAAAPAASTSPGSTALPVAVRQMPAREIRFRDVTFTYPRGERPVLSGFDLTLPPAAPSPSSARTGPARRRSRSCSAVSTTRSRAGSRSTASTCAGSTSKTGVGGSLPSSRTSSATSCRCGRTSPPPAPPTTPSSPPSPTPAPQDSPASTLRSPGAMPAAPISRAGSGSVSPSPAPSAPCALAPAWCCSTSPPPSSTCAARARSSSACCAPPARRRPSSSPIASPPSAKLIGSACSSTAG